MVLDFYYSAASPPCRSVIMASKALGLELNKKVLNTMAGEQRKPEFVKLNPQHTIPTLVDDGFSVWESRAILAYLAEKYGKDDSLYPKSPKERAVVNQRLYFDMGTLYKSFSEYFFPQYIHNQPADPEKLKKFEDALQLLDTLIGSNSHVAGNTLTIADIAILATVSTFDVAGIDLKKHSNVAKWYENCKKTVPGFDENWEGCLVLQKLCQDFKEGKITLPKRD